MPKLLRRTIPVLPFREDLFGSVVGVESKGHGKLPNGYRETCYGGNELQFRVRTAKVLPSLFGDGYANAELRRLGLDGVRRYVCPNCRMETTPAGGCFC